MTTWPKCRSLHQLAIPGSTPGPANMAVAAWKDTHSLGILVMPPMRRALAKWRGQLVLKPNTLPFYL